ncbi:MAG TPA: hypothetical protein VIG97_12045 [Luteimonas sp.]
MQGRPPPMKSPRRALTPGELLAQSQHQAGGSQVGAGAGAKAQPAAQEALLGQFQEMLQQEGGLEREDRDELARVFEQALQDASASPQSAATDAFDASTWRETVEMLLQGGFVEQGEADHLIRSLNEALAPLQRRESRLAMEFSRRVETEGQEKALEWFRQASKSGEESTAARSPGATPPDAAAAAPLRADTVNSRSRRLRGPPGQDWS